MNEVQNPITATLRLYAVLLMSVSILSAGIGMAVWYNNLPVAYAPGFMHAGRIAANENSGRIPFYQTTYGGYVENTLVLWNGTLINGNYAAKHYTDQPDSMVYDPYTNTIYVANGNSSYIYAVNATTYMVSKINIGQHSYAVAYIPNPSENYIYIATWDSVYSDKYNNITVVNAKTGTIVDNISVGYFPDALSYDPANNYIYVANAGSFNVTVIDASNNAVVASYPAGNSPDALYYDTSNSDLYVVNGLSDNITVLNTTSRTIAANIAAGKSPDDISADPANGNIYVTNFGSGNVTVINSSTNNAIYNVNTGTGPHGVAYDPVNNFIYTANANDSTTSVINVTADAVVETINTGLHPWDLLYSTANGDIYVLNIYADSLTIISTSEKYNVTFTEAGLPAGTAWIVNLSGNVKSSSGGSIYYSELNGTYGYTVSNINGYSPIPSSGTIYVEGAETFNISFTKGSTGYATYNITFSESGLPRGSLWNVTLNGNIKSSTGSITFAEPNGSYSYTISNVSIYVPEYQSGVVIVDGSNTSVYVTFVRGSSFSSGARYNVTFSETGMPAGAKWAVYLNGTMLSTTANKIVFSEPNGSYTYRIESMTAGYRSTTLSGSLSVEGQNEVIKIVFVRYQQGYTVYFRETGLSQGLTWFVIFNGLSNSSATNVIIFSNVSNGSYKYTVAGINGYRVNPSTGSVNVSGQSITINATYTYTGSSSSSGYSYLYTVAVIVIIAVVAIAVLMLARKKYGKTNR